MKHSEHERAVYRPHQEGLRKLLGELEARIMEVVWAIKCPVTVKEVHQIMTKEGYQSSYTTVMTVMSRLAEKELLRIKHVQQRANVYEATCSRDAFIEKRTFLILDSLLSDFPDAVMSHFLETSRHTQMSARHLEILKSRIDQKRREEQRPPNRSE